MVAYPKTGKNKRGKHYKHSYCTCTYTVLPPSLPPHSLSLSFFLLLSPSPSLLPSFSLPLVPSLLYLQSAKLKVEVFPHDGEMQEVEGDSVWSGLSLLLSFLSKSHLFSEQGEVRLVGHKTQHDLGRSESASVCVRCVGEEVIDAGDEG